MRVSEAIRQKHLHFPILPTQAGPGEFPQRCKDGGSPTKRDFKTAPLKFPLWIPHCLAVSRELGGHAAPENGLDFPIDAISTEKIKEDQEYEGVRVRLLARMANARIPSRHTSDSAMRCAAACPGRGRQ